MARTGTNTGTPQEPPKRLPEGPALQSSEFVFFLRPHNRCRGIACHVRECVVFLLSAFSLSSVL